MALTPREQELLKLIRNAPLATAEDLAGQLGTTRAAVNVHVSSLMRKGAILGRGYILPGSIRAQQVVVVGGANIDFKARTSAPAVPGTSNPGETSQSVGGVARNVAENLARLGVSTTLISAVGQDALGDALLRETQAAGVDVGNVLRHHGQPTGTYTAVLDANGELLVAVAAMSVLDYLTPAALRERRSVLRNADWVVADGNLSQATLAELLALTAGSQAKVVFEPVSVPKAVRLRPSLEAGLAPYALTPNLAELAALVGHAVPDRTPQIRKAAQSLHRHGIELVWVRRGKVGSLLSTPEGVEELAPLPAKVVDVTGAGDAMLAAFLAGLVTGQPPLEAAHQGHAAAALTIESPYTVVPGLSPEALQDRMKRGEKTPV